MIYLDDLGGQPADSLIDLLRQFAGTYQSDPEIGLVAGYDFRTVLKHLNQHEAWAWYQENNPYAASDLP